MTIYSTITEDAFIAQFQPERNPDGSLYRQRDWTDPEDLRVIEQAHAERRLWTQCDSGAGNPIIVQGYAFVNRDYYIVCAVPVPDEYEFEVESEYIFCEDCGERFEDGGEHEDSVEQSLDNPAYCVACLDMREAGDVDATP